MEKKRPIYSDEPANDAVRLARIYRMLNERLGESNEVNIDTLTRERDEARAELANLRLTRELDRLRALLWELDGYLAGDHGDVADIPEETVVYLRGEIKAALEG